MIIVYGWKPLIIIIKRSILDFAAVLELPLEITHQHTCFFSTYIRLCFGLFSLWLLYFLIGFIQKTGGWRVLSLSVFVTPPEVFV